MLSLNGCAWVSPGAGRVQHDPPDVGVLKRLEDVILDATAQKFLRISPAAKPLVDRVQLSKLFGQVAPGRTSAVDPEHPVYKPAVVTGCDAAVGSLTRQKMLNASLLQAGDAVAKHNDFDRASDISASKAIVHTL